MKDSYFEYSMKNAYNIELEEERERKQYETKQLYIRYIKQSLSRKQFKRIEEKLYLMTVEQLEKYFKEINLKGE